VTDTFKRKECIHFVPKASKQPQDPVRLINLSKIFCSKFSLSYLSPDVVVEMLLQIIFLELLEFLIITNKV
jgi:hypothetical protein